ncbi:MAG: hypothetical protein IPM48_09140 [Saprospiraceae bacterium]|nr:hypothetical protein [Saprospiraceae bacterium]
MHRFTGIIKMNTSHKEVHQVALESVKKAYPGFVKLSQSYTSPLLDMMGVFVHRTHPNGSQLFFSGELYSHTNASLEDQLSDLLQQIETSNLQQALSKLNGKFMICYYNQSKDKIYLATDQMAIQQVFYHCGSGFVLFASELKLLLQHPLCPKEIDWHQSLRRPLPFEVLDGEVNYSAWFRKVFLLKEGSFIDIGLHSGDLSQKIYWNPYKNIKSPDYRNAQQVMDEYMDLLEDAVRIRIQDHDKAYSFLSGGLDSSILCAIAARSKKLDTFSVITRTTLLEETSDICHRHAIENGFENIQFAIPMHRLEGDPEYWKKRIWHAESPINHNDSMCKTLLHDAIRRHRPDIPYVLTGTGSDQLNGGLARWIVNDVEDPGENWKNMSRRIQEIELRHHLPEKLIALWGSRNYLTKEFIQDFSGQGLEANPFLFYLKSNIHQNHFVLLWDEIRAASMHQHSTRFPFLDHRFVSMIAGVPEQFHPELFFDKQILRIPSKRYLPEYILNKSKAPADTGIYDHRFEEHRRLIHPKKLDLLEEALGPLDQDHEVIDKKALVRELERLYNTPDHKAWQYLLNVINLGLLEKLHLQNESSIQYEIDIEPEIQFVPHFNETIKSQLVKAFEIISEQELLDKILKFQESCSIVIEKGTGREFIQKDESLVYELQADEMSWRSFIFSVDGIQSTSEILASKQLKFEDIRDYLFLCLKEKILILS